MAQKKIVYRVSGPLVLSGALSKISEAKCLHALFILAQGRKWEPDAKGMYRVRLGELHRLTGKTHKRWDEYLETLQTIRDNVRLDWGHLSKTVGGFNRAGDTPLITEAYAELDLGGGFEEIAFALPAGLIDDVIKPHWFGQVDTKVLFSLKSNYAFNAYLYASLTVIEKDRTKSTFHSKAFSIDEWRELLGSGSAYPAEAHFRAKVFRRTELQLLKVPRDTDGYFMDIKWIETASGLYQMRVRRMRDRKKLHIKAKRKITPSVDEQKAKENADYFQKLLGETPGLVEQ
jgi:hypothetical protein